jgi:alpha-beta hydrolase superfamily lysophospholipase
VTFALRYLAAAAAAVLLAIASALLYLKVHESQLVFATDRSRLHLLAKLPSEVERVSIPTADGTSLAGLVFPPSGAETRYWILLLHGNADSAFSATQVRHVEALRSAGFGVLAFDYRGFGESGGVASEDHMDQDSEAALRALQGRGVPLDHIVLLGHSLGSGPAVLLALEHRVAALVLFGAFSSLPDAAVDRYPHLPVRHLAGVRFDSLSRIKNVKVPVLIAHSPTDRTIAFSHAERLYAAARAPKYLWPIAAPGDPYGGHVDALFQHPDELRALLAQLVPGLPPPPVAPPAALH